MTNRIFNIAAVALICAGAGCLIAKAMSRSYIDGQGMLHEPFFLLPVGFALIGLGVITLAVAAIIRRRKA